MSDYRIEAKIRNARFLRALESVGESACGFAKARGLSISRMYALAAMTVKPVNSKGDWWPEVMALCEAANIMPCDLFTERQMQGGMGGKYTKDVDEGEIKYRLAETERLMLECKPIADRTENIEIANALFGWLATEYPRQASAIAMQQDGATLEQIGSSLGVTRERARQLTIGGLRRMRRRFAQQFGFRAKPVLE